MPKHKTLLSSEVSKPRWGRPPKKQKELTLEEKEALLAQQEKTKLAMQALQTSVTAQMVDYRVGIDNLEVTKPITYFFVGSKIYEVRQTPFAVFAAETKQVQGIKLGELMEGVTFTYGKIPYDYIRRGLQFFRAVYTQHKAEGLYMLFFNPETKEYVEYVPKQIVSSGSTKEVDAKERPENLVLVLHLHSHPSFNGSFSGVDNNDDKRCCDACCFGVLGSIMDPKITMEFRCNVGGNYVTLNLTDIFDDPLTSSVAISAVEIPSDWLDQVSTAPALISNNTLPASSTFATHYSTGDYCSHRQSHQYQASVSEVIDVDTDDWSYLELEEMVDGYIEAKSCGTDDAQVYEHDIKFLLSSLQLQERAVIARELNANGIDINVLLELGFYVDNLPEYENYYHYGGECW